ncbi:hypothetical protein KI387_026465, partial [Taxus chinensis]
PLRRAWRSNPNHNACHYRLPIESGLNSSSFFIHRREFVEASRSQIHPSLLYPDLLHKNLNNNNYADRIRAPKAQGMTVEDARKVLRLVRLEAFKARLRQIQQDSISYRELLQLCMEMEMEKEAVTFAKLLDESGHILLLGETVHLRPHKVVRALEEVIPMKNGCREREELAVMEKEKAEIDEEAEKRVKGELWWGLGIFGVKTAVFMRWTFWDLSWDVMEPVCFFVTSIYFMIGYIFFLTTSSAPTFGGVFKARFAARQKQLIQQRKFDVQRFKQLQLLYVPRSN